MSDVHSKEAYLLAPGSNVEAKEVASLCASIERGARRAAATGKLARLYLLPQLGALY